MLLFFLFACTSKVDDAGETVTVDTSMPGTEDLVDGDGDGYRLEEDCDDADAAINPGTSELCDGFDNNCDGVIDEDAIDAELWYRDADGDGYGDQDAAQYECSQPEGYILEGGDCDDTRVDIRPGAYEAGDCTDPNDYNCDGVTAYSDADGDGWAACLECNDAEAVVNPDEPEICDGLDNDCNGTIDDGALDKILWYEDSDGDGWGNTTQQIACESPAGFTDRGGDCDDTDANLNLDDADSDGWTTCDGDCDDSPVGGDAYPGAMEGCDGRDDDCDGIVDEDPLDISAWYTDLDGDGYGVGEPVWSCVGSDALALLDGDCDDSDPHANPGAEEVCNTFDDDCDEIVDEDYTEDGRWYLDEDGDGYGLDDEVVVSCEPLGEPYARYGGDCDDSDQWRYPGAPELCDGLQTDCDDTAWVQDVGIASFETEASNSNVTLALKGRAMKPAEYTITEPGTLTFCPGEWYVKVSVEADASIVGTSTEEVLLYGNPAGGSTGGIVMIETDDIEVSLSELTLREGVTDGVICEASAELTMRDMSVLEANTAVSMGSGCSAVLERVVIEANEPGGGVYVEAGDLIVRDSLFYGNRRSSNGGGIHMDDGSLVVEGSIFESNGAHPRLGGGDSSGGAIWMSAAVASITDTLFMDSHAVRYGGAVYGYASQASFTGVSLVFNDTGVHDGGGVAFWDSSVVFEDVTFFQNQSRSNGGAAAFYNSDIRFVDSVFDFNRAGGVGGGVHLGTNAVAEFEACGFSNNYGEDIYHDGSPYTYDDTVSVGCSDGVCE